MIRKESERGVSPVIAVILMVALAIILAAIIAEFSLSVSDILQEPIQAGITISESYNPEDGTYDVTVTWTSSGTVESIHTVEPDGSQQPRITNVGDSITIENVEPGESIQVIGTSSSGVEGVIQQPEIG